MNTLTNTASCTYSLLGIPLTATPATATLNVVSNVVIFTKTFNPTSAKSGDTVAVNLSVNLPSSVLNPITSVVVKDTLPAGLTFVTGSVTLNGVAQPSADPAIGINVGTMNPNVTTLISFNALVS